MAKPKDEGGDTAVAERSTRSRKLGQSVIVSHPETGEYVTFQAGSTPPAWAQEAISNPKAWQSRSSEELTAEVFTDDLTRQQMLNAADRLGITDLPETANKDQIAAAIKRALFSEANPDASLTGDDFSRTEKAGSTSVSLPG